MVRWCEPVSTQGQDLLGGPRRCRSCASPVVCVGSWSIWAQPIARPSWRPCWRSGGRGSPSGYLQDTTGISIKRVIRALKPLQDVTINLNGHHLTAADPLTPQA